MISNFEKIKFKSTCGVVCSHIHTRPDVRARVVLHYVKEPYLESPGRTPAAFQG